MRILTAALGATLVCGCATNLSGTLDIGLLPGDAGAADAESAPPPRLGTLESIRVTLTSPMPDPLTGIVGSPQYPVAPTQVTFDAEAIDDQGQVLALDFDVNAYLSFGGDKVGQVTACGDHQDGSPLATIHLTAGVARNQTVKLVRAFGPTNLWLEEVYTHAVGTSPTIYFDTARIPDIQTPLDPAASTASWCTPFNNRHVVVDSATGSGSLVVTSVFGNAYVVTDTGAPYDATKPTSGFNNLYVFIFSQTPSFIQPGLVIDSVSGNVSKFNGFTELNFPLQTGVLLNASNPPDPSDPSPDPSYFKYDTSLVPAPLPLVAADGANTAKMEQLAGAAVQVSGKVCCFALGGTDCCGAAAPCMPDSQWQKYSTFTMDTGDGSCDSFQHFSIALPSKVFGALDPVSLRGTTKTVTVTGMLQNSTGQNIACAGTATPAPVACTTDNDCVKAASTPALDPACVTNLMTKASCVDSVCRRGNFFFYSVVPRTTTDVVIH